ncbi:hypothetical protein HYALB_00008589 [Hymenoscyphus albidus]|uniref:DUF967 domain protein n=1 Tax=Hymenoscyphus albidus TaxID=595503 RepID=A0A9N9LEC3_9HELO|nr:hypothetical protein HYALB_00008589 [Hymenoscyphus albidus]
MSTTLCGLRRQPKSGHGYTKYDDPNPPKLKRKSKSKSKSQTKRPKSSTSTNDVAQPMLLATTTEIDSFGFPVSRDDERETFPGTSNLRKRNSANFEWARLDQLSVILEKSSLASTTGTPHLEESAEEVLRWDDNIQSPPLRPPSPPPSPPRTPRPPRSSRSSKSRIPSESPRPPAITISRSGSTGRRTEKRTRWLDYEYPDLRTPESGYPPYYLPRHKMSSTSGRRSPITPRLIEPPPTDLEEIQRIDDSLCFEHFTTEDAWELGSALRTRLMPVPTPVVINIALANQNQVLFHTCTHTGIMPDNDNWVARKRKTVLRWGTSTWYMSCKFNGDETAFKEKYGLGNSAGEYAIHGGGVPIRVSGVEGVVAVVVVSGLKQHEDHAVIVEVIRELYY